VEAVALRWLIDQGTFPVTAARWSASAGPWATFGHTYGLQATAQAAAGDSQSDASPAAAAASSEEGTGQPIEAEQPTELQQQQQGEVAGVPQAVAEQCEVLLGGGGAFVPGVDGALFQVASFLDAEDVAALGNLCGAAV
jgi:hypothetical protein